MEPFEEQRRAFHQPAGSRKDGWTNPLAVTINEPLCSQPQACHQLGWLVDEFSGITADFSYEAVVKMLIPCGAGEGIRMRMRSIVRDVGLETSSRTSMIKCLAWRARAVHVGNHNNRLPDEDRVMPASQSSFRHRSAHDRH